MSTAGAEALAFDGRVARLGRHHRAPSSTDDNLPQAKGSSYDSCRVLKGEKRSSLVPSGQETIIRVGEGQDSIGGLRSVMQEWPPTGRRKREPFPTQSPDRAVWSGRTADRRPGYSQREGEDQGAKPGPFAPRPDLASVPIIISTRNFEDS